MNLALDRDILKATMASNDTFDSIPDIAVPIITVFNNPKTCFRDLADLIGRDPELAAKVMKIANSGYYGVRRKVNSLTHAVVLLGWNTIKMLALGSTILSRMNTTNKKLFEHSMRTGMIARFLAVECRYYKVEEIAVVGLLHDIGTIILETYFPEHSLKAKQYAIDAGVPIHLAEREVLGVDHGEVGGWTLEEWNLPKNITSSVMWHHDYKARTYHARKTALIHVADVLAQAVDVTGPSQKKIPEINPAALKTMDIAETDLRDLVLTIMKIKLDPLLV